MYAIPPYILNIAATIINFLAIYAAYLIIARKVSTQATILKASAVVTVGSGIVTLITMLAPEYIPAGCDLIAAMLLMYHCGRSMLHIKAKPAILSAVIYLGILIAIALVIAILLVVLIGSPAQA